MIVIVIIIVTAENSTPRAGTGHALPVWFIPLQVDNRPSALKIASQAGLP